LIIKSPGTYILTQDFTTKGTNCIGTAPKGTIIKITQIDPQYKKVIGPSFYDWTYWDMPVEEVKP